MIVVDASYLLAILLDELNDEDKKNAIAVLDSDTLLAPQLLELEVGNTLMVQLKRKKIDAIFAQNAMEEFIDMDIATFSHNGIDDLQSILIFSNRHQVTFYDALYLKLALKMNCKLASFDKKMIEVASFIGIERV